MTTGRIANLRMAKRDLIVSETKVEKIEIPGHTQDTRNQEAMTIEEE